MSGTNTLSMTSYLAPITQKNRTVHAISCADVLTCFSNEVNTYSRIQRTHLRVSSNLKADLSVNSVSKNELAEVTLKLTLKYGKNLSVNFSHLTVIYSPVYFNLS